jgi:micrococcal nuclease
MWRTPRRLRGLVAALSCGLAGCSEPNSCGPADATVRRALDGDTIELTSGERVRYLLVDTPEIDGGAGECYAQLALAMNRSLVEHRHVELRYEPACTDRFGRLLAYVSVDGREVNSWLVEQGYACVLHLPPSGDTRVREYLELESEAQRLKLGLWGACAMAPCGN